MLPEDIVDAECEVWPENERAVAIFLDLGTQWRHGMGGVTGLDYSALWTPIRLRRVPRDEWQEVFEGIRIMERAVLEMKAAKDG